MESLKMSEQEQRLYAELFHACDVENTGKVSGVKASELFLTSGLGQDILHQITELCGAKRLGHFGRSQFYIALKLIAVAQCGLPVSLESFNSGIEIPLPVFGRQFDKADGWRGQVPHPAYTQPQIMEQDYMYPDRVGQGVPQQSGGLPPPPKHARTFSQGGTRVLAPGFDAQTAQTNSRDASPHNAVSPQFSPESPPISPTQKVDGVVGVIKPQPIHPMTGPVGAAAGGMVGVAGPQYGSTGYVNSQHHDGPQRLEKGWASFEEDNQGLISHTSETKQWANFPDHSKATDTSSISSEAESVDDIWSINDEQREYYVNQFKTMQTDLNGVISGAVAKEFFEKSKLPVQQLSKIWQLSDVDRDGSLSLEEFCTAMHLVVLRRNDVELPDHLPPSLLPYVPLVNPDEPFAADLPPGSTLKRLSPVSPQPNQWTTTFPPVSPTSSSVSSPGTKPAPVNFEFKPITADSDSKIVHPVALRMSPDGQPIPVDSAERAASFPEPVQVPYENLSQPDQIPNEAVMSPTRQKAYQDSLMDMGPDTHPPMQLTTPLQSRPRPTPKKAQSISGPTVEGPSQRLIRPPPSSQEAGIDRPSTLAVGAMGEGAPPPPPRAKSGHSRSSSLDNQLIDLSEYTHTGQLLPPPAVPPRPSPKDGPLSHKKLVNKERVFSAIDPTRPANFANFSKFETIPSQEVLNVVSETHPGAMNGAREHRRCLSLDYNQFSSSSFGTTYQSGPLVMNQDNADSGAAVMPVIAIDTKKPTSPGGYVRKQSGSRDDLDETDKTAKLSKFIPG